MNNEKMNLLGDNCVDAAVNGGGPYTPITQRYQTRVLTPCVIDGVNVLTKKDVNFKNTKYVIKYDFDIRGEEITIPAGCIIEFDGGSICSGTYGDGVINFNDTVLSFYGTLDDIFKDVELRGTWTENQASDNVKFAETAKNAEFAGSLTDKVDNKDGMGKIYLKKNKTIQEQMTKDNSIYVVQYDFDLKSESLNLAKNSIIEFDGGVIKNAELIGNSTIIVDNNNKNIFEGVSVKGTWLVKDIKSDWFSDIENDKLSELFNFQNKDIENNIYINEGKTYKVSAAQDGILKLTSNTNVIFNGTINVIENSLTQYRVFMIDECSNVSIKGAGVVVGDRENHTYTEGSTHEFCHGVLIRYSKNITIDGLECSYCPGDGFTLGGLENGNTKEYQNEHIILTNIKSTHNRRQGISVIGGSNIIIENFFISDIDGTDPKYGIDIEPNKKELGVENLVIRNGKIYNVVTGIALVDNNSKVRNINIENTYFDTCNYLLQTNDISKESENNINVSLKNITAKNIKVCYFAFWNKNVMFNIDGVYNKDADDFWTQTILQVREKNMVGSLNNCVLKANFIYGCNFEGCNVEITNSIFTTNYYSGCSNYTVGNKSNCNIRNCNINEKGDYLMLPKASVIENCVITAPTIRFESTKEAERITVFKNNTLSFEENNIGIYATTSIILVGNIININNESNLLSSDPSYKTIVGYNTINGKYTNVTTLANPVIALPSYRNVGSSANRPNFNIRSFTELGSVFYDTTLKRPLWWNGGEWINSEGKNLEDESMLLLNGFGKRISSTVIRNNNIENIDKAGIYIARVDSKEFGVTENANAGVALIINVDNVVIYCTAFFGEFILFRSFNLSSKTWGSTRIKNGFVSNYTNIKTENLTNGSTVFDTTLKKQLYWSGSAWVDYEGYPADAKRSGSTANRPNLAGCPAGYQYYDTDLSKFIAWNGSAWVNVDGTALT